MTVTRQENGVYILKMKNGDEEITIEIPEIEIQGIPKADLSDFLYRKMEEGRSEILRRGAIFS